MNWTSIINVTTFEPIVVILITTAILVVFSFWYFFRMKKVNALETPKGLLLLVHLGMRNFDNKIRFLIGEKFSSLTSYLFLILVYVNLGNFVAFILNFKSPFIFLSIILSFGLITFLGIFYFNFKFDRWNGLKKLFNPFELLSRLTIFISISFRLFGNMISGFIIISLVYIFLNNENVFGYLRWFNVLSIFTIPLHAYFNFFSSPLHVFIFITLTLTYWALEKK